MKKVIYCVVIALLACLSVNAQKAENVMNEEMAMEADTQVKGAMADEPVVSPEIAAELSRPTLLTHAMVADYAGDYKNNPDWQHAKGVRTTGIIMTSVGAAVAIGMGITAVVEANKEDFGGVFSGILSTGAAIGGAGVAIAGGIMWIVANNKMNKIRLASNGAGLAYTF